MHINTHKLDCSIMLVICRQKSNFIMMIHFQVVHLGTFCALSEIKGFIY